MDTNVEIKTIRNLCIVMLLLHYAATSTWSKETDVRNHVEKPVKQAIKVQQAASRLDAGWRVQREALMASLTALEKERDALANQKDVLSKDNAGLKTHIETKSGQLEDIRQISGQITPFLSQVLERLKDLIQNDTPFLKKERDTRIRDLTAMMADPTIRTSEKFRRVMEALLVEAEYGRTVEVYQENINFSGHTALVKVFRLGRVSLFFQTLDERHCGIFDVVDKNWKLLPDDCLKDIRAAMNIGARQRPVELLSLPVGRIAVQ